MEGELDQQYEVVTRWMGEGLALLLCGACHWHLGLAHGRHRRRDCVWKAAEALLVRLKALRTSVCR